MSRHERRTVSNSDRRGQPGGPGCLSPPDCAGREDDYQFWETGSGEEGLRLCAEIIPNCILLDYQLPDLDGLEFLDRVRALADGSFISVIMLTGHGNEAVAVQAMKKGVQDYLVKGINNEALKQVVQSAIDKGILRKQVAEQRRELESLSVERLQLVKELQQQTAALAEASRRKDEFLAMLGHELRNPLAPVRNALHILQLRPGDIKTVEQVRQMMDRQITHMSHIIDDLLDVSRIRGGKVTLRPERVDLVQLVRQIADSHYASFQESSVALNLALPEEPVWATVDATRLTQVVENLLTNAIKFTNPGGSVTLGLAIGADKYAVLVVRDTGIGLEATMLNRLFDTFAQADRSLDRNRGGLGLGLALVKGLVELHDGTVEASSDGIGHGATFTIRLPLDEQSPATPAAASTVHTDKRKPLYIVLVEDNRDAAESLRIILELLGHTVTVADSGPTGVQAVRREISGRRNLRYRASRYGRLYRRRDSTARSTNCECSPPRVDRLRRRRVQGAVAEGGFQWPSY